MSPPKPTHPLAHLPDPPQNYIPCAPTKYWPSTMDEEQHSSQGNKWWWLVYLGPMQGAYATRLLYLELQLLLASPLPPKLRSHRIFRHINEPEPWVEEVLLPLARPLSGALRAGHCRRQDVGSPNDSAGSISGVPHARHIAPLTPHDTASSISHIPCAGPAVHLSGGWGQGGGVSGGSSQTNSSACVHPPPPQPQRFFARRAIPFYPHSTPSRPSPPSSSPPAYSPPSWSLTKPKPYAKTEPEPRIKLKSGVKQEVKLKPNLQHDVERSRSRSHVPVPLYNPDSESDESMDKFKAMQRKLRQLAKSKSMSTKLPPTIRGGRSGPL
ncbi:hypothetical protein B0H13DRAFT_1920283 [Mycena leptocephala]|nr:hypothetical protein B0H13DRAFT_1920283 [Mycena leptocephala]